MKSIRFRKIFWLIVCIIMGLGIIGALYDELVPKKSLGYLIYSKDTLSAIDYLVVDGDTTTMLLDSSDLRNRLDTFEKNRFYSN